MTLKWTTPEPERPNYWQAERYDWWIASKTVRKMSDYLAEIDRTYIRWVLYNGENELGAYDTLAEAQEAAEPEHVGFDPC